MLYLKTEICKTIISPAAFYGSDVWSRSLNERTKDIRKVKIQSTENIFKAFIFFFDSLVALLQHAFIYFAT
jgi:hypothetical protein